MENKVYFPTVCPKGRAKETCNKKYPRKDIYSKVHSIAKPETHATQKILRLHPTSYEIELTNVIQGS